MKKTIPCLSDGVKQIYLIETHKKPSTQKRLKHPPCPSRQLQKEFGTLLSSIARHCCTTRPALTIESRSLFRAASNKDVKCRDAGAAGISGGIIPVSQGLGKPMISFSRLATSFLTMEKVDLRCSQLDGRSAVMKTDN